MEIKEHEIYTTSDVQKILKISQSTTIRLIKRGLIRSAKVGSQYRILGKELLRIMSSGGQEAGSYFKKEKASLARNSSE